MKTFKTDFLTNLQRFYASPWLFLFCFVLIFIGGVCVVNFDVAMTPEEAIIRGYPPMPSDWEAGVFNHGEYIHWLTIEKHPILYALSLVMRWFPLIILAPKLIKISMERYRS